jgi:hypothetical protein
VIVVTIDENKPVIHYLRRAWIIGLPSRSPGQLRTEDIIFTFLVERGITSVVVDEKVISYQVSKARVCRGGREVDASELESPMSDVFKCFFLQVSLFHDFRPSTLIAPWEEKSGMKSLP